MEPLIWRQSAHPSAKLLAILRSVMIANGTETISVGYIVDGPKNSLWIYLHLSASSHINERYLDTPQKTRKISKLRNKVRSTTEQVRKLREKIKEMSERFGETIDDGLHSDLTSIMKDNQERINHVYTEGSFARLFWEEQFKAASLADAKQMRWHPAMIKWCLNLSLMSGCSYRAMRSSGFIKLPSERTLRDYTNYNLCQDMWHARYDRVMTM